MALFGIDAVDAGLEARLRERIDSTEAILAQASDSAEPLIADAASHLLRAGGKRFRPLLSVLAAELGSEPGNPEIAKGAAVVELTHLATLYHDDVMDEAPVRRGAPSANARWDNAIAILVGDYLFAQASKLVADLGPEAVRIQAETFARLVAGQIRETVGAEGDDALEHYLGVVADKTGSLIATAALFGAKFAGADDDAQKAVTEYGERIGIAFQLADDIIDITSETGDSGKTPGTDLREGVPTLPVLFALRSDDPADARLKDLVSRPLSDDDEVAEALALLRTHRCMEQARAFVEVQAEGARESLQALPAGPARDALEQLCDTVIHRLA